MCNMFLDTSIGDAERGAQELMLQEGMPAPAPACSSGMGMSPHDMELHGQMLPSPIDISFSCAGAALPTAPVSSLSLEQQLYMLQASTMPTLNSAHNGLHPSLQGTTHTERMNDGMLDDIPFSIVSADGQVDMQVKPFEFIPLRLNGTTMNFHA